LAGESALLGLQLLDCLFEVIDGLPHFFGISLLLFEDGSVFFFILLAVWLGVVFLLEFNFAELILQPVILLFHLQYAFFLFLLRPGQLLVQLAIFLS
jgi:hypothetical protein